MKHAIVLFAHGSKDPQWANPIYAIANAMQTALPQIDIRCAFLELTAPSLEVVTQELAAHNFEHIRVIPMFLGIGKHAQKDLPHLMNQLKQQFEHIQFELEPSIGERANITQAIAHALVWQFPQAPKAPTNPTNKPKHPKTATESA